MIRIDRRARDQRRYDADIAAPIGRGVIDRDGDVDIEAPPPCFEFSPVEDVGRSPRAVKHDDPAVTFTVGKHAVNHWAQRSETEPARHDDDVAAFALGDRPIRAIGSAHPNDLFATQPGNRATDSADCPHRVHDPALLSGVSAEADRDFAQPEHVKHVELACDEGESRRRRQFEGCHIRRLTPDSTDTNGHRQEAVG